MLHDHDFATSHDQHVAVIVHSLRALSSSKIPTKSRSGVRNGARIVTVTAATSPAADGPFEEARRAGRSPVRCSTVRAATLRRLVGAVREVVRIELPLSGCANATIFATNQGTTFGITADATNVYWTSATQGTVMKCATGGCNQQPTLVASGQAGPAGIAVDATNIYWANGKGGTVVKLPK